MSQRVGRMGHGKNRGPFRFREETTMPRRANHDLVDVACVLLRESPSGLAWLLDCGNSDPVWVPKSVCELDVDSNGAGTVTLPESWASDKGMI